MIQKQTSQSSAYVSCIKIRGVPILPPLVTQHDSEKLQKYKEKALEIEKRIASINQNNPPKSNQISHRQLQKPTKITTLEHELAFNDKSYETNTHTSTSEDISTVPYKNQSNLNLTCNIVDISEYSDEGVKFFEDSVSCASNCETERNVLSIATDTNIFSTECDKSDLEVGLSVVPKPRLIRSNSYTLESPSPILLAHIEKQRSEDTENYSFKSLRNWCSLDNDKLAQSFGDSIGATATEMPKQSNVADESGDGLANTTLMMETAPLIDLESELCNQNVEQSVEVANKHSELNESETINSINHKNESKLYLSEFSDVEQQLLDVLNNVPEKYTKQILDLLEKKIQNDIQSSTFMEVRKILLLQPDEDNRSVRTQRDTEESAIVENKLKSSELFSIMPTTPHSDTSNYAENAKSFTSSQTIYYSMNGSNETLNVTSTPLGRFTDVENDSDANDNKEIGELPVGVNETKTNKLTPVDEILGSRNVCKTLIHESVDCTVRNILNCSKELFPEEDAWIQQRLKQEWAASVIGAHVKGYLVRRIMATDKVRSLIQTIKDALICAMDLHSESTENIRASDVELHRRLIQQVSAACYAFHDIFFTLTIPQQMALIAHDRLRQEEKLRRPSSVRSATTPTNRKVSIDTKRPGSARFYRNKVSF